MNPDIVLKNPCRYSFSDLAIATGFKENTDIILKYLHTLSQDDINHIVKDWCSQSGWYYKDVVGGDSIVYTSFSPELM